MKLQGKLAGIALLMICAVVGSTTMGMAQSGQTRDPLKGLKRAISDASAPALTSAQEADLNTLITAYQDAQPDEPDAALETARKAFDAAILAGDQTAANAQAVIISNRAAVLSNARLQAEAKFQIAVLAILKAGSQLDALTQKLGADRLLDLVGSLAGHSGGGHAGGSGGPGRK